MTIKNIDSLEQGKVWNTPPDQYLFRSFSEDATAGYYENFNSEEENDDENDNVNTYLDEEELEEIHVEITSIDKEKGFISGKFNFKGTYNNTGNTYIVPDN